MKTVIREQGTCQLHLVDVISGLEARIAKLERDADPRTADGDALDRWARIGTAMHEAMERVGVYAQEIPSAERCPDCDRRLCEHGPICHEPLSALAIGTRVRIDDKSLAWHDEIGTVVRVPGPGDAPDVFDVDLEGGTITIHRASLALVDDTLPECAQCRGAGTIPLFSGVVECDACGGSGVTS